MRREQMTLFHRAMLAWTVPALLLPAGCGSGDGGADGPGRTERDAGTEGEGDGGGGGGGGGGGDGGSGCIRAGCPCAAGTCGTELVCDSVSQRCREPLTCEQIRCVAHRLCTPPRDGQDALCRDECEPGFAWDDVVGRCWALQADCQPGSPVSILERCDAEHRECLENPIRGTASCGGCLEGWLADPSSGACRQPRSCEELSCAAAGRRCEPPAEPGQDATCGGCLEGFREEGGQCRPETCAGLTCPAGQVCEERDGGPACRPACGANQIWSGSRCVSCPPCDKPGELGIEPEPTAAGECICRTADGWYYSRGNEVGTFPCDRDQDGWVRESARALVFSPDPVLQRNARCHVRQVTHFVLRNEAGQELVVQPGQEVALFETDRNDDEEILRLSLQQRGLPSGFGTPDEGGEACDPFAAVDACPAGQRCVEEHCTPTERLFHPAELNRLTKYCVTAQSDMNDNGVADVEEWAERPPAEGRPGELQVFDRFSYFAELHRGWWEPDPPNQHERGRYVIAERSRRLPAPDDEPVPGGFVPLGYLEPEDGLDGSWRQCTLARDRRWNRVAHPVGMDFASYSVPEQGPAFSGMLLHSQFKCMKMVSQDVTEPYHVDRDTARLDYRFNHCRLTDEPSPHESGSPAHVDPTCTPATQPPRVGAVRWAAVRYFRADEADGDREYMYGCLDECQALAAGVTLLEGRDCLRGELDGELDPPVCRADRERFGRLVCGEACGDGLDNDGDGQTDEADPGDPELGGECLDPSQIGRCQEGHWDCVRGRFVCRATYLPPPPSPDGGPGQDADCNGLDDDCDGQVDEDARLPAGWEPSREASWCLRDEEGNCSLRECLATLPPLSAERCAEVCADQLRQGCRSVFHCGARHACIEACRTAEACLAYFCEADPPYRPKVCISESCRSDEECHIPECNELPGCVARCLDGSCRYSGGILPGPPTPGQPCARRDEDGRVLAGDCGEGYEACAVTDEQGFVALACPGGQEECPGTFGFACLPRDPTEVCDGHDNDCDDRTDEPEDLALTEPLFGVDCTPPGQEGYCAERVWRCVNGQMSCEAKNPRFAESCNGVDDDCDGTVDNLPGQAAGTACDAEWAYAPDWHNALELYPAVRPDEQDCIFNEPVLVELKLDFNLMEGEQCGGGKCIRLRVSLSMKEGEFGQGNPQAEISKDLYSPPLPPGIERIEPIPGNQAMALTGAWVKYIDRDDDGDWVYAKGAPWLETEPMPGWPASDRMLNPNPSDGLQQLPLDRMTCKAESPLWQIPGIPPALQGNREADIGGPDCCHESTSSYPFYLTIPCRPPDNGTYAHCDIVGTLRYRMIPALDAGGGG